jgi:hypothetical protein
MFTSKTSDRPSASLEIRFINLVGGSVDPDDFTCTVAI